MKSKGFWWLAKIGLFIVAVSMGTLAHAAGSSGAFVLPRSVFVPRADVSFCGVGSDSITRSIWKRLVPDVDIAPG